jgi:hypothetical protein
MECRPGLRRLSRELHFIVFGHLCGPPSHWQHFHSYGSICSGWGCSRLVRGSRYMPRWSSSASDVSSGRRRSRVASCRDLLAGKVVPVVVKGLRAPKCLRLILCLVPGDFLSSNYPFLLRVVLEVPTRVSMKVLGNWRLDIARSRASSNRSLTRDCHVSNRSHLDPELCANHKLSHDCQVWIRWL